MKTKMRIPKRALSLVLALVMVVSMLPMMSMTAYAAASATSGLYTLTLDKETYGSYTSNIVGVKDVTVVTQSNNTLKVSFKYRTGSKWTGTYSVTVSNQDCTKDLSVNVTYHTGQNTSKEHKITGTLTRPAQASHTGGTANCTTGATCTVCGITYGSPNDTHNWGDWAYSEDGKHTRTCTLSSAHTESGNCDHKAATCLAASACSVCGHEYAAKKDHSYTYSPNGNVLTETCANGCDHNETAKLEYATGNGTYAYTGSEIKPLKVTTSSGWQGGTLDISYSANTTTVGAAKGVITKNGKTAELGYTITEADIRNATIALSNSSYVYNGQAQKPTATVTFNGIPLQEGVDYKIYYLDSDSVREESVDGVPIKFFLTPSDCIDAGQYYVVAYGIDNFKWGATDHVFTTYTINPATITVTPDSGKSITYGEEMPELTYTVGGKVGSEIPGFTGALAIDSTDGGTHKIKQGTLALADNDSFKTSNYTLVVDETVDFTVSPTDGSATVSIEGWEYGDTAKTPVPVSSTNGVGNVTYQYKVKDADDNTYTGTVPTEAGFYTVKAVFGATQNYNAVTATADFEIKKADPAIGAVTAGVVKDTLETSAIVLTRENTKVDGMLTVNAGQTLALGQNTIRYTFAPTDTRNYTTVTGEVTVTVQDTIAPTGTVTISTSSWDAFLNNITFGLFFKETQTVKVAAEDALSGVDKIEYIESETAMDQDAVKAAQQWTEMQNGSVSVTPEDAKQFIYYIRITDKSGNIAYLSTDGAEYDTTAPVVSGVVNDGICYTTQTVTVTDKNINTITLNGEAATGSITLEGNKEATYTIVATDKAGNSTTVTVKMAPIADITGIMEGKTEDNVTSDDKDNLQTIVDTATELLQDEDITEEEKTELEKAKADAQTLIDAVEAAAAALDTGNTQKVENITDKNAKPKDKEALLAAKADLEKALEDNAGNYTEKEKQAIQGEIQRIEKALKSLVKTPATGDDSNIMLHGAVFTVSLAALVILLFESKKRRYKNA